MKLETKMKREKETKNMVRFIESWYLRPGATGRRARLALRRARLRAAIEMFPNLPPAQALRALDAACDAALHEWARRAREEREARAMKKRC